MAYRALLLCVVLAVMACLGGVARAETQIDLKVLVIAVDGGEPTFSAITRSLEFIGVPYDVFMAGQGGDLTANMLADGDHARYQAILLTDGQLSYTPDGGVTWMSALSEAEWQTLRDFEAAFGIRRVVWYVWPNPEYGFDWGGPGVDTGANPLQVQLTAAGAAVFPYMNAAGSVTIRHAWTYLATPLDGSSLITDGNGHTLAVKKTYTDGRECVALTFDSADYCAHNWAFSYGLISWACKGVFLGHRRVYLSPQVDDIFFDCHTPDDEWYRNSAEDIEAVVAWQNNARSQPTTQDFRYDFVYNGEGTTWNNGSEDALLDTLQVHKDKFKWINHTYTHTNLNAVNYATAVWEIMTNHRVATKWRFKLYSRQNMVTPEVSGLQNPEFMRAAYAKSIRYLVTDTSQPGYNNPSPNAGIYNPLRPKILMIPRYPTELYEGATTPDQWVGLYNGTYSGYWGRDLTYQEILADQSDMLLMYLLRGDANPLMFHQGNLRAYDGQHSLLSDLLDMTLAKYNQVFTLPIKSPMMNALGQVYKDRMNYNASGVSATMVPGKSITLTVNKTAWIPVTGVQSGSKAELYGGQWTSFIKVTRRKPLVIKLQAVLEQLSQKIKVR